MVGRIRKYFTCANSCKGFVNYFDSNLKGMRRIFLLKGGPGTGKSTLMKKIGEHFQTRGEDVEFIYCSSDAGSLDGVIVLGRGCAVVDATAPHAMEPTAPGAVEDYVNLGEAWNNEQLEEKKEWILDLKNEIAECYTTVYSLLRDAKEVHDAWEKVYIDNTNYEALEITAKNFVEQLKLPIPAAKTGKIKHRFFGALTPDGSINYIDNLTEGIQHRYLLKGRPGTGKSTLLKTVLHKAVGAGMDAEAYHCSFDPDSLDMVILRDLGIAVFDATAPHDVEPDQPQDTVADLYAAAVRPGTDDVYKEQLESLSKKYDAFIERARTTLERIHVIHDDLEAIYIEAMDFRVINRITKKLIRSIEKMENKETSMRQ